MPGLALSGQSRLTHLSDECTFNLMTLAEYLAQPGKTAVAIAARCRVSHSTVLRWAENGVPAERLEAVAAATGIAAAELRPDLARVFARGAASVAPAKVEAA